MSAFIGCHFCMQVFLLVCYKVFLFGSKHIFLPHVSPVCNKTSCAVMSAVLTWQTRARCRSKPVETCLCSDVIRPLPSHSRPHHLHFTPISNVTPHDEPPWKWRTFRLWPPGDWMRGIRCKHTFTATAQVIHWTPKPFLLECLNKTLLERRNLGMWRVLEKSEGAIWSKAVATGNP